MFPQHPEVLGDRRLGNAEFALDDRAEFPGRMFALGEQFQDPTPDRIPEYVERVHADDISAATYISQV